MAISSPALAGIEYSRSSFIMGDKLQASSSGSSSRRNSGRRMVVAAQSAAIDSHFVLGLDYSASKQEIKRAYRNLALQYHPDVCKGTGNEHVFTQINLAYECLMSESQSQQKLQENSRVDPNSKARSAGSMEDEWLSEGYTFEEIFGKSPCYQTVDESLFREVEERPRRKVKKGSSREDW
ncbi:hypothetical protein SELMODRAFT_440364 [Selaginella moellendorffii]|uniref:J domain-containing protein n=1 Tax=Selaginella moellendorffii TaxID=88036 RepID=D8RBB0_SELML|nr:uncharacterized protein LOC9631385 [Selaginella moellendorffii]EFJ30464.1 hypothetical protein SELMODRAFT_440364 [Selaginella moellendorffii]|eukprot:XP_002968210.1 uncharacterized protein LOC9631385 [Selaginella moellendorffii]